MVKFLRRRAAVTGKSSKSNCHVVSSPLGNREGLGSVRHKDPEARRRPVETHTEPREKGL